MTSQAFKTARSLAAMGSDPKAYADQGDAIRSGQRIVAEHHTAAGVEAGTNTIGSWTPRPITRSTNTIPGATVDSGVNTVTLPAGMTFRISGYQDFLKVDRCHVRVLSLSGDTVNKPGAEGYSYATATYASVSLPLAEFILTTTQETVIQMQYLTQTVNLGNGLGLSSFDPASEVAHAQLVIERVA